MAVVLFPSTELDARQIRVGKYTDKAISKQRGVEVVPGDDDRYLMAGVEDGRHVSEVRAADAQRLDGVDGLKEVAELRAALALTTNSPLLT